MMGLFGASLVVAGMVTHHAIHKVDAVSMGGYSLPPIDENAFVWGLFMYGVNIGLFLFGMATCVHFFNQRGA